MGYCILFDSAAVYHARLEDWIAYFTFVAVGYYMVVRKNQTSAA
jgi:hypothetical protein